MGSGTPKAAEVVEVDERGKTVRGTKQTASRRAREARESRERHPRGDVASTTRALLVEAEGVSPPSLRVETVETLRPSRARSTSDKPKSPRKSSRPPSAQRTVSFPELDTTIPVRGARTDPSYYGVSPTGTKIETIPGTTSRAPRPYVRARPQSMYGAIPITYDTSRPPPARSAFYVPPTTTFMPTSYPPQSPISTYDSYFPPQPDPASRGRLAARLGGTDPVVLTSPVSTSREVRDLERAYYRSEQQAEDARRMPPPAVPYRRPGDISPSYRSEYIVDDHTTRPTYRDIAPTSRRRSLSRGAATYEYDRADERGLSGRRGSYESDGRRHALSSEDKMREALREAHGYQDVVGGPPVSLTAEALRKSQRAATSSRSTRSSGSRNESDFKRSATTQTTRSSSGQDGDDVTIKFRGTGTVEVAGAKIQCDDGADINFIRRKSIRNGSERSESDYGRPRIEDRRSRDGRPANYSRSSSKSARRS